MKWGLCAGHFYRNQVNRSLHQADDVRLFCGKKERGRKADFTTTCQVALFRMPSLRPRSKTDRESSEANRGRKGGARERADDVLLFQGNKRTSEQSGLCSDVVPVVGLEPTRYRYQRILSPSRLPIPSHRPVVLAYYTRRRTKIQEEICRCVHKNEQTVKSAENPKKGYPKTGGCAMIVSVKLCAFDGKGGGCL